MKSALATFGNAFGLTLYDKAQLGVRRSRFRPRTRSPGAALPAPPERAVLPHLAPLLPDRLALARRQIPEEVLEAAVVAVLPVVLHADSLQEASVAQSLPFGPLGESDVSKETPWRSASSRRLTISAAARESRPPGSP